MDAKQENNSEVLAGSSIFPTLNDTPGNTETKTILLRVSNAAVEAAFSYCKEHNIELRYFLAATWAAILAQFTDSNSVHFGISHDGPKEEEHWNRHTDGNKCFNKSRMQLAAAVAGDKTTVGEILCPEAWSFKNPCPALYESFNTGIGIFRSWELSCVLHDIHGPVDENQTCKILLAAQVQPAQEALHVAYRTSILSEDHAKFLAGAIEHAILAITQDTSQVISHLDLVSPLQRGCIARWNDCNLATIKASASVVGSILENPAWNSDSPAIHAWDGIFTFAGLGKHVSRVSGELRRLGVKPGFMIPLCFEKSKWAVVAMLGVLRTGAGFIPIDPSMPAERLKVVVGLAEPVVAITSASKRNLLIDHVETVVVVSEDSNAHDDAPSDGQNYLMSCANPDDAAYCLFTSGSTGAPKGCIISYRALENIRNSTKQLKMHPGSRALQFANFAFTISLYEIFGTLFAGGTVCIPSDEDRLSNLIGVINDLKVNWAVLTPTTIRLLRPSDVTSLETLVFGGEPIQDDLIEMWKESVQLVQSYGMTETTGICSLSDGLQSVYERRDIGKPVNAKFWLVRDDDHTKLAPIGAVAELVVEGPCLANGYLNLPQLTEASFVKKPSWTANAKQRTDAAIVYKTGDLVRYSSTGKVNYVGRKDRQIKIRGQRLELQEVEFQLIQNFPHCEKAIVEVIQPAERCDRVTLCAFIQIGDAHVKEGNPTDSWIAERTGEFQLRVQQVDAIIRSKLPGYMVPQLFVPIVKAPVTWTGKTDRRELKAKLSTLNQQELHSSFGLNTVEPEPKIVSTYRERIVQSIWSHALGIIQENIRADDNFFHVGGDSVTAMKVAALARVQGFVLTVSDIFKWPQLGQLSNLLSNRETRDAMKSSARFSLLSEEPSQLLTSLQGDELPAMKESVEDILPVTGQQMFFFSQWTVTCFPFRINGPVDVARLLNACRAIVARHSILRSIFAQQKDGDKVFQIIMKHIDPPFQEISVDEDLGTVARRLADDAMSLPPISAMLPLQFTLISKSPEEHAFLFTLSHSQMDGFSFPGLFQELTTAYNKGLSSLPTAHGFSDYVYFCKQELDRSAALKFWTGYLHNSTIVHPDFGLDNISVSEDVATSTVCKLSAVPPGITVPTLVNSALSLLLSKTTGRFDLVFGLVMSTRGNPVPGIDIILGPCSNINPVRVRLSPSWTGLELCESLQEQYLETSQYDWLDWVDIASQCEGWAKDAKLGYMVSHVDPGMTDLPLRLEGTHCSPIPPSVKIDVRDQVMIRSLQTGNTLGIQVRTSTAIMDQEKASAFGKRLLQLVELICQDPGQNICSDYYY